jgi:hypothetical protein
MFTKIQTRKRIRTRYFINDNKKGVNNPQYGKSGKNHAASKTRILKCPDGGEMVFEEVGPLKEYLSGVSVSYNTLRQYSKKGKNYCGYFNEGNEFKYHNNYFFCQNKIIIGNLIRMDRLSSFFGKEMILGSFLSRFLPLVTALYILNYKRNSLSLFFIFFLIVTSLFVFLSGERISFFYLLLFLLIFFISIESTKLVKFFSIFFLIMSIFITSYFYKISSSRMYVQTFNQILNSQNSVNFFSDDHKAHAITAYNIFKLNTFIGAGPKVFRKICHKQV